MQVPPLNAVRVFEAAARNGSFRAAADELFVTPGAVSQQIRMLEDHLAVSLFERRARAVRLTPQGQEFFAAVTRHLRGIAQAAERIKPNPDTVLVSVVPTFASRWLMPRLAHFTAARPAVQVRVDATATLVDFNREGFDLAIRLAPRAPADLASHVVLTERIVPLCSPGYREEHLTAAGQLDWSRVRLLHEGPQFDYWDQWLASAAIRLPEADAGMYFSHGMLVLSAAVEGQGIALQPAAFVERELKHGDLVIAHPLELETGRAFRLVWPRREMRTAVEQFRDWMIQEAERDQRRPV